MHFDVPDSHLLRLSYLMVPQSGTVHSTEHHNFGSGWTGIATSVWSKHVGGIILDLAAPVLLDWSGQHM